MDNESLAQYGTPLQQLNQDNVYTAKALQPSNQIVTDKQGRRRFHGAFTGGFSAGFFNSVGSKEGWTPSTFVSSRTNRAEKPSQNDPSVYMDDEDLNSFGIASEQIQATTDYGDLHVPKKRKKMCFERDPIPGIPVLEDLVKPVNTTMGMKLLMKLGWRPGQGIGPRVSGNQKNKILAEQARLLRKNVDKASTHQSSESEDEEEEPYPLAAIGFAPDDVECGFWKEPKADFFGLGYKPLDKSCILGGRGHSESLKMIEKRKRLSIKGQAFGVGVFEDDDDDIYTKEDMSDYDFILTPSDENMRETNITSRDANVHALERDLEGFCLSEKNLPKQTRILLPTLPLNFKPYHESYSRRFDRRDDVISYRPSAGDRNRILFHQPSVEVRSGVKRPETLVPPISTSFQSTFIEMPPDKGLPSAIKIEEKSTPSPEKLPTTKKESEKEPFARLGELQKPFSMAISSRFVASSGDEGPFAGFSKGLNTLAKCLNSTERSRGVDASLLEEQIKEDVKAAKMKIFGPLTQTSCQWQPDKILSKRFNVPHPFPNSSVTGVSSQLKKKPNVFSSISDLQSLVNSPQGNTITGSSKMQMVESEEKHKEQEENLNLAVSASAPPTLDLFKAIFDNSSESEEEECEVLPRLKLSDKKVFQTVETRPGNALGIGQGSEVRCESPNKISKNKRPFSNKETSGLAIIQDQHDSTLIASKAKGLFKGIDFTALNEYRVGSEAGKDTPQDAAPNNSPKHPREWPKSNSDSRDENKINHERRTSSISSTLSEDEYGPEPPPYLRKGGSHSSHSPKSAPPIYSVPLAKLLHGSKKKKHKDKHKKAKKKKKESKRPK